MSYLKFVRGQKVRLDDWIFQDDLSEPLSGAKRKYATHIGRLLEYQFRHFDGKPYVNLPYYWTAASEPPEDGLGNSPVRDPLTLYVSLDPLNCTMRVSFKDVVKSELMDEAEFDAELDAVRLATAVELEKLAKRLRAFSKKCAAKRAAFVAAEIKAVAAAA